MSESEQDVDSLDVRGPRETNQRFDGWKLYRRLQKATVPVRRYCNLIAEDYKLNRVTVCAHLQNLFTSYNLNNNDKSGTNYFDLERWNAY
jgi:hypothetical protein